MQKNIRLCVSLYFHCLFHHLRMSGFCQPFECLADGTVLANHLGLYQLETNVKSPEESRFPPSNAIEEGSFS